MIKDPKKKEFFLLFRGGDYFYPVEIPRDQIRANIDLNLGTVRVEDMEGNILWERKNHVRG